MNIEDYFKKLNKKSQAIFNNATLSPVALIAAHSAAIQIYEINSVFTNNTEEIGMIGIVCSQIETSAFSISLGLYRSGFASLRLALEFGLGAVFFSANKFAHQEWKNNHPEADLKWSNINDPDTGVFSTRFVSAFYPELKSYASDYRTQASALYRTLSEYVHGNSETWTNTGLRLEHNPKLEEHFVSCLASTTTLILFSLASRYLSRTEPENLDQAEVTLNEYFSHITPIRTLLGGPEDIN